MKMITLPDHCARTRGADCQRCRIACPVSAISFQPDGSPSIDSATCTKCGVCMGVCDAFSSSSATTMRLYSHLRKVAMRGEIVYLTCEENIFPGFEPAKNVTVLPCLACIPSELWTLLLAQNVPVCIACDLKYCEDCARAPKRGELLFTRAVEIAESQTGSEVHFDREIPEYTEKSQAIVDDEFDRRTAFDSVKDDAFGIISGKRRLKHSDTLKEAYLNKERARMRDALNLSEGEFLSEAHGTEKTRRIMAPRRRMLLEAYAAKPEMSELVEFSVSATDRDSCVECLDCTKHCLAGARIATREGHLDYDARYCMGCGACEAVCPREAIEIVSASLRDLLPEGPGRPAIEPNLADYE